MTFTVQKGDFEKLGGTVYLQFFEFQPPTTPLPTHYVHAKPKNSIQKYFFQITLFTIHVLLKM